VCSTRSTRRCVHALVDRDDVSCCHRELLDACCQGGPLNSSKHLRCVRDALGFTRCTVVVARSGGLCPGGTRMTRELAASHCPHPPHPVLCLPFLWLPPQAMVLHSTLEERRKSAGLKDCTFSPAINPDKCASLCFLVLPLCSRSPASLLLP
jgi:hypothetical protein